ncbi:MAG: hypothetical protein IRY99_25125 [Isosphaeraceae bacterium]|nr:hypothetical protein [Isosphaeraceae bacterium]
MANCITSSASVLILSGLLLVLALSPSMADEWPPVDPGEYTTKTDFSMAWAKRLRGFQSLADLQRAAGSKGAISERSLDGPEPHVTYHWRSEPTRKGGVGYMIATVRPDGRANVDVITTDSEEVILDNRGTFISEPLQRTHARYPDSSPDNPGR